jgi:hypothetical protein
MEQNARSVPALNNQKQRDSSRETLAEGNSQFE